MLHCPNVELSCPCALCCSAALLLCGGQNNQFHGKVMGGSVYIFSCPFTVAQPLENEVVESLATLPKSSEESWIHISRQKM